MSSTVRNGFSTLNRLLGKKNKNSSLSKSTSNLSTVNGTSITNPSLDSSSQYNKIMPLAASSNAPFEQTFRITICLPRDQLYVVRVGAKTKLRNLLEMVCFNKQLDMDKYEFRHPGDSSQVFNNEWTIGEVGLNEIRLALKTDRRDTFTKFHTDEIMKLRHNSRESISSSEMSKHSAGGNAKYMKTTSPYSSTNSLNSIDSTGMSNNSRSHHHPPVAPTRKKRMAPRPPSQNSIPENGQTTVVQSAITENHSDDNGIVFKAPFPVVPRKKFHVSSPNLANPNDQTKATTTIIPVVKEFNNNNVTSTTDTHQQQSVASVPTLNETSDDAIMMRPTSQLFAKCNGAAVAVKAENRKTYAGGETMQSSQLYHSRTSSDSSGGREMPPEPTPRKRPVFAKKKAPPAPPPRGLPPVAPPRTIQRTSSENALEPLETVTKPAETITETVQPNDVVKNETTTNHLEEHHHPTTNGNVSKVMLNANVEPEQCTTSTPPLPQSEAPTNDKSLDQTDCHSHQASSVLQMCNSNDYDESASLTSSPSSITKISDNSSDEDETTNIYSIQLGKPMTITTPSPSTTVSPAPPPLSVTPIERTEIVEVVHPNTTVIEHIEASHLAITNVPKNQATIEPTKTGNTANNIPGHSPIIVHAKNRGITNLIDSESVSPSPRSESPVWTYTLPEPPTLFADGCTTTIDPIRTNGDGGSSMRSTPDTETVVSDTSDLSDLSTKPIHIDDTDKVPPPTTIVMTSDIEDGYLGDKMKFSRGTLLHNLERQKHVDDDNTNDADRFDTRNEKVTLRRTDGGGGRQHSIESYHSVDSAKSHVLEELNDILVNNKLDTMIRKNSGDDPTIGSSKPSSLGNFSIQTYTNHGDAIKTTDEPIEEPVKPATTEAPRKSSNEFAQSKRSSLTNGNLFRAARINRSDSFHSTAHHDLRSHSNTRNGFVAPARSSSYISLFGTPTFDRNNMMHIGHDTGQLDESNRRKSASELSIADLPSLQSLLVMKSILSNSRLNFDAPPKVRRSISEDHEPLTVVLRNGHREERTKEVSHDGRTQRLVTTGTIAPPSDTDVSTQNGLAQPVEQPSAKAASPIDEQEKKWKYQGPPSINLSTWGDRPKSQIVIKSDTDYKFGGSVGGGHQVLNRTSNVQINSASVPTAATTNGNAEVVSLRPPSRPFSVVSTTKSEPQPMVRPVSMISQSVSAKPDHNHLPIVRAVEYKKNVRPESLASNTSTGTAHDADNIEVRRPSYEVATFVLGKSKPEPNDVPPAQYHTSTMTLGRVSQAARFSQPKPTAATQTFTLQRGKNMVPLVKGFKTMSAEHDNKPIERTVSSDSGYKSLPMQIVDQQSMANRPKVPLKPAVTASKSFDGGSQLPFSQFTLRKTGLKDRILADSAPSKNTCDMLATKSVIELTACSSPIQLRQHSTSNGGPRPHSVASGGGITYAVPPPPPPSTNLAPPIIRSVTTKNHQTIQVDPRDQLLNSIRSFNKEKLKRK